MRSWIYRKPEPSHVRGLCVKCNKHLQKTKGAGKFRPLCSYCDKKRHKGKHYKWKSYSKYKLNTCEECGFEALDSCQLDIHHKDGNHHNNDPNNLETLCSNCHRLRHKRSPEKI